MPPIGTYGFASRRQLRHKRYRSRCPLGALLLLRDENGFPLVDKGGRLVSGAEFRERRSRERSNWTGSWTLPGIRLEKFKTMLKTAQDGAR